MKIYNTLTRRKEEFEPIRKGQVNIYVCGPTVYNYIHIGNARPIVVFDTLRRYMEYRGYKVKYAQNFTDVDDKIINRAKDEGVSALEISERFIKEYFDDADALNVRRADVHPKVSEHIDEIENFVDTLVGKGFAYEADGDVYFSTRKFPEYGKLSGQNIEDLEAGARIAVGEVKEDPIDFALWKARKTEDEIAWESPWGMGRPGWHTECCVMAPKYCGGALDIHAGGEDLIFPHHENEIAQYEAAHGEQFARYWMHNAFINIDNKKMSKSLGNFFTVRDVTSQFDPMVLRFYMLSAHYRSPLNFSKELMQSAKASLDRILSCIWRLEDLLPRLKEKGMSKEEEEALKKVEEYTALFSEKMEDDLNTADAITQIFELVRLANSTVNEESSKDFGSIMKESIAVLVHVLGIRTEKKEEKLDEGLEEKVNALIAKRQEAKKNKDFTEADRIRDELLSMGISLKDTRNGVEWQKI